VEVDPERAAALFTEVAVLAPGLKSRNMSAVAHGYLAILANPDDARGALAGLREMLDMYKRFATGFGLRFMLREWLFAFSQLGRHEAVAIVDGASMAVTLWPQRETAAITAARAALGDGAFERSKTRGGSLTDEELDELIRRELG
jgi:hypothetical protein